MGTSISPMAPLLLTLPIQIVTPNFELGRRLNAETKAEVFVLGGRLSRADRAALGPMAEENLRLFQFHRAFLGCMGLNISKNTAYETDMECMRLKKIAMENAAESYLLADRSKLSIAGLFCFSALDSFRQVFIDGPRPEETEFPQNFIFAD
jgi:DeoR/GlpR family transcriptional regulator of sugar metabolism